MDCKDKLFHLYDRLNESDQKTAYDFIKFLANRSGEKIEEDEVLKLYGKNYFVVPD